jgi:hypothetical protein
VMGTLDKPVPCELTPYGFTWGPTTVSRITTHHGTTLLEFVPELEPGFGFIEYSDGSLQKVRLGSGATT